MDTLFLKLLNMSIAASWLILAVIILRFILKKAPKQLVTILWLIVFIRLTCPVSFESILCLLPSAETVSPDILYTPKPTIKSGVQAFNSVVNPIISDAFAPTPEASVTPLQVGTLFAAYIWLLGLVVILIYAVISYLRMQKQVKIAINIQENLWICDDIKTPFIMGLIMPRIYLPSNMGEEQLVHVIAHETAHLRRHDHWWKFLGFLLLAIYWFNPIIWLAYGLFCSDIELACDEKVIRKMSRSDIIAYSETLFSCSVPHKMKMAYPLAFGEVGVKKRIKTVLTYKKPTFWIVVVTLIACLAVAVCFLTNPIEPEIKIFDAQDISSENKLSLNDVIILSQKGKKLSWSDFEAFSYIETGSGLYIRIYEIDPTFSLWIGGGSLDSEPLYISLHTNTQPEDSIDIRTESVMDFIAYHKDDRLNNAISATIMEHSVSERAAGLIPVESHKTLATTSNGPDKNNPFSQVTVYALVLYQTYEPYIDSGTELKTEEGHYSPIALTFSVEEDGSYILREYWQPRDGSYYVSDIKEKFPDSVAQKALNDQEYIEELQQESDQKALAILNERGIIDEEISRLLENICSSPVISSNPGDYMRAHQEEYEKLISYGEYTLRYCYGRFLEGSQNDLGGHIMAYACQDILKKKNEILRIDQVVATGQDWFNAFLKEAEKLQAQYSKEELEKHYPSIWLLLQMAGQNIS